MKKVNVYLLRENLAKYLTEVEKTGETIVVYKYKKPIATIVYPKENKIEEGLLDYFGFLGKKGETGDELVKRIRRNKKEKRYVDNLRKGTL